MLPFPGRAAPLALALLLIAARPGPAAAQPDAAARSVRLVVDNDLIAVRGAGVPPDHDYTHGSRLSADWVGAPAWAGRLAGRSRDCRSTAARERGCLTSALALGQEIYTPRQDAALPVPGERPYGGWLYAAAAARAVAPGRVRSLGAELGVTGRPSLAAEVQDGVHRLLHNEPQLGWAYQLGAAPGVVLRYGETRRAERATGAGTATAVTARWGAAAGNVVTALSAGAEVALGAGAEMPWSPAAPEMERPRRLYAIAGYRQDVVLHSVFIDGRAPTPGARRRPLVGQAEAGVGYRRRALAVEYRYSARGREYDAQPRAHAYGSLAVTVHGF